MANIRRYTVLEDVSMEILAMWLDRQGVLWMHCPNEAKRSPRLGAKLKRCGLKPGVPDVLIFTAPPRRPEMVGTALELKRMGGSNKATPEQERWLKDLAELDWISGVKHGHVEAIEWLTELGYQKGTQ